MIAPLSSLLHWPEGQAPYAKQEEAHAVSSGEPLFALLMEQRCGKAIVSLGTAVYQYHEKNIDAMVVIAMPSGIPQNWAEEIDVRVPPSVNAMYFVWRSNKTATKNFQNQFECLMNHGGLAVLLMNGEAITTEAGKKALGRFLRKRRALVIGDETTLICSLPGNMRSKVMRAVAKLPGAVMRRILDGTPAEEGPIPLFSQFAFLSPSILGFTSFTAFKCFVAKWERRTNHAQGRDYPVLVEYQNLDEVQRRIAPYSFRVKRTDVFDIPDKVYSTYHYDLSHEQRRVYDSMLEEYEAELRDGTNVSAPHVLARMTRLSQICANYYPHVVMPTICGACEGEGCEICDDVGAMMLATMKKIIDPKHDSRMQALEDVLSANKEPGILWCRFSETVDAALRLGEKLGRSPVRYDGQVDDDEKLAARYAFQGGAAGLFVAKASSAGRGLNLSAARFHVYVENEFSLLKRSQSEDRAEVGGRTFGTGVIDLCARGTIDEKMIEAHKTKTRIASIVMGEKARTGRFFS
jgi:hypothetical protein